MDAISRSRDLVREAFQLPGKWAANLAKAEGLLMQLIEQDPENALALTCLGTVLCDQGKYDRAALYLQRSVALGSADRNTYFALAVVTLNTSTHEEAVPIFAKAAQLASSSESWEAYFDAQAQ